MKFQKNTRDIWIETLCEKSEKILVYLTKKGKFEIIQEPLTNPFIAEIPPNSIAIGTLRFIERNNNELPP